ncbi:Putative phosphatase YwpJ [Candidatus Izimaplasma bacterium HR1]|uniref:HAD family hydrolase n=1 Tax=Candidatus Izimoplasma sp. HR1 TaxID=1541959 RepID=UPI0004F6B0B3|nr:Putative phosphatase YwpJ [Candidatus Izimaplasma bacterium HR1]
MTKKLFAFDVDGTLLDHKYNEVPASALDTIEHLKKQGHVVGVATGRNQSQFQKALNPEDFDFVIYVNGGYLEIDGKKVYDIQFSQKQKNHLCDLFDDLDLKYGITTEHHLYSPHPMADNVQRIIKAYRVITPERKSDLRTLPVYQFSLYEGENALEVVSELEKNYSVHSLGEFAYDITIPKINKGIMLKEVAKIFNIDMKDTIAFGDGDNDRDLLKEAGIGIAMGNAVESAKKAADKLTTPSYENGVYNGVKELGYI